MINVGHKFSVIIYLIFICYLTNVLCSTTAKKSLSNKPERIVTDRYTVLVDDIKWFFKGVAEFAQSIEYLLPNVMEIKINNQTFTEKTRLTFLVGLRHLLVGIREISTTFEQNFETEHIKQLQQIKHATDFVRNSLDSVRLWFGHLRILMANLFLLYNHYIPEVLLGKCISHYLRTIYPDHYFYEYPTLLLMDIYKSIVPQENVEPKTSKLINNSDNSDNKEQNEIVYGDNTAKKSHLNSPQDAASLFDLRTVLYDDKNLVIEKAANKHSLQICLKLYTAESLSRTLKNYFIY